MRSALFFAVSRYSRGVSALAALRIAAYAARRRIPRRPRRVRERTGIINLRAVDVRQGETGITNVIPVSLLTVYSAR